MNTRETLRRTLRAMTASGLALGALVFVPGQGRAQSDDLAGKWVGEYGTPQSGGRLELELAAEADGAWTLMVLTTSEQYPNSDPGPATEVSVDGDELSFVFHWGPTRVFWKGRRDGDGLSGELVADHFSGVWSATRAPDGSGG